MQHCDFDFILDYVCFLSIVYFVFHWFNYIWLLSRTWVQQLCCFDLLCIWMMSWSDVMQGWPTAAVERCSVVKLSSWWGQRWLDWQRGFSTGRWTFHWTAGAMISKCLLCSSSSVENIIITYTVFKVTGNALALSTRAPQNCRQSSVGPQTRGIPAEMHIFLLCHQLSIVTVEPSVLFHC